MKVFLGGTVNGSKWRNIVKEKLIIDYFDPVVDDWNDAAYERELSERRFCTYLLYVLTPRMTGYYAVAEVTDDSYQRPDRTLYCYLPEDDGETFSPEQLEEFEKLGNIVRENGAVWLKSLDEVISFLNSANTIEKQEDDLRYDGFISFGRGESQKFANTVANRLTEKGKHLFMDMGEIPLMVENEEYVYSNILRSDNFIYVISPNTVRSEYCKKELEFAIKFNKRLIPVFHENLGKNIENLDDIVAKKRIIEIDEPEKNISKVIDEIDTVIETDKEYVQSHSNYLYKALKWDRGGRKQKDLLYGVERKKVILWGKKSSESLVPLKIQEEYISASKSIHFYMLPLLWLNKHTHRFTHLRWFDKIIMLLSLVSPIAMMDQIVVFLTSENEERYATVSLTMWVLFFIIQMSLLLRGIKDKDVRLFLSMLLSLLVSGTVIIMVLANR
jgi:TIR domain-containing protein